MAELRIQCQVHNGAHRSVEVQNATSMGYSALHVAEALGHEVGETR